MNSFPMPVLGLMTAWRINSELWKNISYVIRNFSANLWMQREDMEETFNQIFTERVNETQRQRIADFVFQNLREVWLV